jgi:ribosomal protein S18 acetylase RimI-like enzyme
MNEIYCLRPAVTEDLEDLYRLDQSCFRDGIAYTQDEFTEILSSAYCVSTVAVTCAGAIAGLSSLQMFLRKGVAHVLTIEVAPAHQRCGLGSLLMRHMEFVARWSGSRRMLLEVAADDAGAQSFYFKMGYQLAGRIPQYYMDRLDALRMTRDLD